MADKYIFLDIDGVLCLEACSKKEYHADFFYPFHPECLLRFNEILSATNAEIILTSDWRKFYDGDLELISNLFKFNGVIKSPIGCTPDLAKDRDAEITSYIVKYNVKQFLVLDDMPLQVNSLRFIRTNLDEALMQEGVVEKAISILNSEQSNIYSCLGCDKEFQHHDDQYACSKICRDKIEELKVNSLKPLSDKELFDKILESKVSSFYLEN